MKQVTLEFSSEEERRIKWLLGRRYGRRKGLRVLIVQAVWEVIKDEAEKLLREGG